MRDFFVACCGLGRQSIILFKVCWGTICIVWSAASANIVNRLVFVALLFHVRDFFVDIVGFVLCACVLFPNLDF